MLSTPLATSSQFKIHRWWVVGGKRPVIRLNGCKIREKRWMCYLSCPHVAGRLSAEIVKAPYYVVGSIIIWTYDVWKHHGHLLRTREDLGILYVRESSANPREPQGNGFVNQSKACCIPCQRCPHRVSNASRADTHSH
jgi:hypothetical protein